MSVRTVVVLSPHFPPATLAGVHRARHLAKHLPAHGWRPIILRAHENHYTEQLDPALASLVPESTAQRRTGAVPAKLARLAGIGDIGLRAWPHFRSALTQLVSEEHVDAVLITGSPFYPMLLSGHVRRRLGLPVVLDFQDPWVSVAGATRPPWTKGWASHKLATSLEPGAVRHASFITSVSDRQNGDMADRYPWLDRSRMAAVPIGGDPGDFEALRSRISAAAAPVTSPDMKHFVYIGTFLPRAGPLVETLFNALKDLRDARPGLEHKLHLTFIGTSNQPDGRGGNRVLPIAEKAGVAHLVTERPARLPYLDALSRLANADGLLMIGSDEPHYTASKIYPNLMAQRPFLSLFHAASSAHAILASAGGGTALSFSASDELIALRGPMCRALSTMLDNPGSLGVADPGACAPYTAHSVAGQFADILNRVRHQP